MAEEIDVIQHLLDVEREAAQVIQDAQKEADGRIAAARAKADAQFKAEYSVMYGALEQEAEARMERAGRSHDEAVEGYRSSLESTPKDAAAFASLMDSLLFG